MNAGLRLCSGLQDYGYSDGFRLRNYEEMMNGKTGIPEFLTLSTGFSTI
jgi:hypothetical protein